MEQLIKTEKFVVVDDEALKALLTQKDAEIVRLKAANTDLQRECTNRNGKIADLERLLSRAADAMEPYRLGFPDGDQIRQLIAELRKAVE